MHDEEVLRRKVTNVVETQQGLYKVVEERVKKKRERQGQAASIRQLLNFALGDYVIDGGMGTTTAGSKPMSVSTWIGSLAICNGG